MVGEKSQLMIDSKERVALDLMLYINTYASDLKDKQKDKKHYLTLYNRCLRVVNGGDPED